MKIQSLSVCVPAGCKNDCKFCVAGMEEEEYENKIGDAIVGRVNMNGEDTYYNKEYKKRMQFARDNGCNTVILTGNGEPIENMKFLDGFSELNKSLETPFRWIELQTAGVELEDKLEYLRKNIGVSVISLSLSDICSSMINAEINNTPDDYEVDIEDICKKIKDIGFVLRLSLNMTYIYNYYKPEKVFKKANKLGADQVTLRELYHSGKGTEKDEWIETYKTNPEVLETYKWYIKENGERMDILPFGAVKYSLNGLSVVVDSDCMNEEVRDTFKYLILRPDCKLYTKWDKKESVLF